MSDPEDPRAWIAKAESDYAVRARYPGDEPTIEEARDAVATARAVRRIARSLLAEK
jgi:hypothetical protein